MIKNIHFTGIKGVGMAALAVMAKEAGMHVTGSDIGDQFITDVTLQKAGIVPFAGFSPEHVNDAELVVTTAAHGGYSNPEVLSAKEKGIRVISMAEAVGMCMQGELFGRKLHGISVAGTHGKTTTTAMIATVLVQNKLDPSFFIGTSDIPSLGTSGHYGQGDFFVVEADEYATEPVFDKRPKFLWHHPKIAVLTNIELDHPDIYPTIEDLRKVFLTFIQNNIAHDGVLVANGDDHEIQKLLREYSGRVITYGFNPGNDFTFGNHRPHPSPLLSGEGVISSSENVSQEFDVIGFGTGVGRFTLHVPGEHNALNALAAIVVGLDVGLSSDAVAQGLQAFQGSKRRFECKGHGASGAMLYDDYGHHPTEVAKTLAAARSLYPNKRIVCIFQPHTYSRTKALFNEFVHCFTHADEVVLTDIFSSAREQADPTVSSQLLAEAIKRIHKSVHYLPTLADVVEYVNAKDYGEDTVVITMGAGDVYKVGEKLVQSSKWKV